MNDDDMLVAARSSLTSIKDSLSDVRMERPPGAIIARARGRRLRRGLPGVGAAGLALGIGLALAVPGHRPAAGPAAAGTVHVNLAAWSVNTTPAGRVTVTVRELKDPAGLSKALADAGIPVILTFGRVCTSGDESQLSQVVRKLPGHGDVVLTISPAAMPAGTQLVIGIGTFRDGSQSGLAAAFGLTSKGSAPDCQGTKA